MDASNLLITFCILSKKNLTHHWTDRYLTSHPCWAFRKSSLSTDCLNSTGKLRVRLSSRNIFTKSYNTNTVGIVNRWCKRYRSSNILSSKTDWTNRNSFHPQVILKFTKQPERDQTTKKRSLPSENQKKKKATNQHIPWNPKNSPENSIYQQVGIIYAVWNPRYFNLICIRLHYIPIHVLSTSMLMVNWNT